MSNTTPAIVATIATAFVVAVALLPHPAIAMEMDHTTTDGGGHDHHMDHNTTSTMAPCHHNHTDGMHHNMSMMNCTNHTGDHSNHTDHDGHDHSDHDHSGHDHSSHDHSSHAGHSTSSSDNDADSMKAVSLSVIMVISLCVGMSMIFLPKTECFKSVPAKLGEEVLSHVSCFSAGVFLAVGVGHLLAHAVDILNAEMGQRDVERYRPAYLTTVAGFLGMIYLQKGLFRGTHCHGEATHFSGSDAKKQEVNEMPKGATSAANEPLASSGADSASSPTTAENDQPLTVVSPQPSEPTTTTVPASSAEAPEASKKEDDEDSGSSSSVFASFTVLAIHSILEGLSLGLQQNKEGTLLLFIAIVSHQWALDVTIAIASGKAGLSVPLRVLISGSLACMCPIGTGIGWGVAASVPSVTTAYIFSISAGIFIFIAASEVVPSEMPSHMHRDQSAAGRWGRIVALTGGIGLLYLIMVLTYSEEAHNH